jgi:hypothetical protein
MVVRFTIAIHPYGGINGEYLSEVKNLGRSLVEKYRTY